VLSLFTHLPVDDWRRWLKTLASAVRPGGLLLISVHNEGIADHFGVSFDEAGRFFQASSESPSLDPQRYGTTFTTRAVVEEAIRSVLGVDPILYQPLAFWIGQDAVAIQIR